MFKLSPVLLSASLLILTSPMFGQYYVASTVAGNGQVQIQGLGGPAVSATLISPRWVATDTAGNVFVSDNYYHQVFRVNAAGTITLVAGTGLQGFSGDGGTATQAQLDGPAGLAVDTAGNLFIADSANGRIRKVTAAGVISTVASIPSPNGLAVDGTGILYVSQSGLHTIRQVRPDGTNSIYAGTGTAGFLGDLGLATAARLFEPTGVKLDAAGNLFFADTQNRRVRKITPQGIITTVAGNGALANTGDGGLATAAPMGAVFDIAIDANNVLYIADGNFARVRVVNGAGIISPFAGGGTALTDGPAAQAGLTGLSGIAVDNGGNLVMAVNALRQVRRITGLQVTSIAGVRPTGTTGDNVQATSAPLLGPSGIAADASGNVHVSDSPDSRVRKISPAGIITTAAGSGIFGTQDGTVAAGAEIGAPRGLVFDAAGNLLIVSGASAAIRKVTPLGVVSTVAGGNGPGFSGDGGAATAALLSNPTGVAVDATGNIFVADTNNHRIRRVDAASGIITTVAGSGTAGFAGDDGPAIAAQLFSPRGVAFDRSGNLHIADTGNNRVRKVSGGSITTVAGTGALGFSGDGGPATQAVIAATAVAFDSAGNLFIIGSARVRKVDASSGIISTIAGKGDLAFGGDGGLATNASFDGMVAAAVDASGNVYIADAGNWRVRKLTPAQIVAEGVANGGTLKAGAVAPGEIISIFGFDLGPASPLGVQLDGAGKVATQVGGTQVFFDGVAAPLLYVSPGQVNAVVPYGVTGATTQVKVVYQGKTTNTVTLPVVASSPGIFAITNQDARLNTASNPAAAGSVLILYATGEGQTSPAGVDGNVANSVFPKPILPVTVQIGGRAGEVLYAGAAPGFVSGVLQVNVRIPAGVTGTAALQLKIGNATTPTGINVTVR
jgi:uncharacterized protein (TIGR03437 family)